MRFLHKFSTPEGRDIFPAEFKPLPVLSAAGKALMPVLFDAYRVICLYYMKRHGWFGELNSNLILTTAGSIAPANLVVFSRFQQIHIPDFRHFNSVFHHLRGLCVDSMFNTNCLDVFPARICLTPVNNSCRNFWLPAKPDIG